MTHAHYLIYDADRYDMHRYDALLDLKQKEYEF